MLIRQGRVDGRPGEEKKLFGYTQDKCPEYGCLLEVREDTGRRESRHTGSACRAVGRLRTPLTSLGM